MKAILFLLFFLLSLHVFSQDIYLKVKKGTATLDSESLTSSKGARKLNDKSKVTIGANSLVLVKQNKKLLQLKEPKTYKMSQLKQLLAKQKELSSSSYASVLFSEQMQKPVPPIQSGAVTRGGTDVNWNELEYLPTNAAILLTDTMYIKLLNAGVSIGDSITLRSQSNDFASTLPIYEGGIVNLQNLVADDYEWELLVTALDPNASSKTHLLGSRIRIPSQDQKTAMQKEAADFKSTISSFDSEIQLELLQEFYTSRNWSH